MKFCEEIIKINNPFLSKLENKKKKEKEKTTLKIEQNILDKSKKQKKENYKIENDISFILSI